MARQIRIEYPGAVYHVMARGNQGRPIFADDLDRQVWVQAVGQACEKTGWRKGVRPCKLATKRLTRGLGAARLSGNCYELF